MVGHGNHVRAPLYMVPVPSASHQMLIGCGVTMIQLVIAMMVLLQPVAPWRTNYENVARGILDGARESPVFEGETGFQRTVALDISIAWFESRFDQHATGDHGAAHGLYQVHAKEDETVKEQTVRANLMIRESFRVCKSRPLEERLGWYAAGGNGCSRGLQASRFRMWKAMKLYREFLEGNAP